MVTLSRENPRYGYRRVWALLNREGCSVNKKRAQRLWREADLKVPAGRQRKRRRIGGSQNGCTRRRAKHINHVWTARLCDGHHGGWPEVEADARRGRVECLALEAAHSITAEEDVLNTLARLFMQRGEPDYIRSDNGPEFIAKALKKWLAVSGVKTLYIEPGAPWENA